MKQATSSSLILVLFAMLAVSQLGCDTNADPKSGKTRPDTVGKAKDSPTQDGDEKNEEEESSKEDDKNKEGEEKGKEGDESKEDDKSKEGDEKGKEDDKGKEGDKEDDKSKEGDD